MSPGSEWELFLPANLAYGNAGWQGVVDPGETLIYNLKLIEVIKAEEAPPRN
jgi:FKBP-type peptidyl-prolyl cis-trans isomerase FklB